eukprot:1150927-Pelagomonas_calceolata.AAC.5
MASFCHCLLCSQALHERLSSASGSNCNDNGTAGSTRSSRQQHSDIQEAGSAAAATDVRGERAHAASYFYHAILVAISDARVERTHSAAYFYHAKTVARSDVRGEKAHSAAAGVCRKRAAACGVHIACGGYGNVGEALHFVDSTLCFLGFPRFDCKLMHIYTALHRDNAFQRHLIHTIGCTTSKASLEKIVQWGEGAHMNYEMNAITRDEL